MVDLYCDESHDDQTYALGGWIAAPSGWELFAPRWRAMLDDHPMPDGSPMSAFHTSEIVNRELMSGSRFKGWTFDQEKAAFAGALDVIEDRTLCSNMFAVGCCIAVPPTVLLVDNKDTIWFLLFARFLTLVVSKFEAFYGLTLTFDSKPEVKTLVDEYFASAFEVAERIAPGKFASASVRFRRDEEAPGLQAADLLMYEWRRRLSDEIAKPDKPPRRSYLRLREVCPTYSELHYLNQHAVHEAIRLAAGEGPSVARTLLTCPMLRTT